MYPRFFSIYPEDPNSDYLLDPNLGTEGFFLQACERYREKFERLLLVKIPALEHEVKP